MSFKRRLPEEKEELITSMSIWVVLFVAFLMGIVFIWLFNAAYIARKNQFTVENIGIQFLLAGSSYAIGVLVGFLFAIPRILNHSEYANQDRNVQKFIAQNDNLVQISDWLTKIIVGVGLTQLHNIPGYSLKIGTYFSTSFSASNPNIGTCAAISTIVYFLIIGFLSSYLWTRLYLARMLDTVEGGLNRLKTNIAVIEKKLTATTDSVNSVRNILADMKESKYYDDPNKGKFGGKSQDNDREISAIIEKTNIQDVFRVELLVRSLNDQKPLDDVVIFHLHPQIVNPKRSVKVKNGIAELTLNSIIGPFTIGAVMDNGKTSLELDLLNISNLPDNFIK